MKIPESAKSIPEVVELIEHADVVHVKTVRSERSLREFMASMLSYMPEWMRWLYRVRKVFVTLFGTRQEGIPDKETIAPEDIDFEAGGQGSIFTVLAAEEGEYWAGEARDRMIAGYLVVVADSGGSGGRGSETTYHVLTMARYLKWTGAVYFFFINPFHHVVVHRMARAGAG